MSIKKTVDGAKKVADQAKSKAGTNSSVRPKIKKKKMDTDNK
jgi:hypothetical protein